MCRRLCERERRGKACALAAYQLRRTNIVRAVQQPTAVVCRQPPYPTSSSEPLASTVVGSQHREAPHEPVGYGYIYGVVVPAVLSSLSHEAAGDGYRGGDCP
eukprot:COSAG02_NODE_26724_length_626_cov_0.796964_1_plen_101_part_10